MKTFFGIAIKGGVVYVFAFILFLLLRHEKVREIFMGNYIYIGVFIFIVLIMSATLYKIKKFKEAQESRISKELIPDNSKEVGHEK